MESQRFDSLFENILLFLTVLAVLGTIMFVTTQARGCNETKYRLNNMNQSASLQTPAVE